MEEKNRNEFWPLYKAALYSSPVISLLLVSPIFLIASSVMGSMIHPVHFWIVTPLVTLAVFVTWLLHIALIRRFGERMQWQRFIIANLVMLTVSTFIYLFLRDLLPIHSWVLQGMRVINIIAVNSIIYMISNYLLLIQTKKKLDIENEKLKFSNLEARYRLLHNQINPHFLFNSIGTAKSLIRKDPSLADEYLVKLSSFLRLGFDSRPDTLVVKEELALCLDYIDLQQMRFGKALAFEAIIDPKYLNYCVPYFSMLTLVENAVKHNAMTEEDPLRIVINNQEDALTVKNNRNEKFLMEPSDKTGLVNLSERYRLLFNQPVLIISDAAFFSVTIKMIPK